MSSKLTLLDMTQNILSAMSSDEVNSISDTSESMQVAQIIKNKYYDIVSRGDLPEHNQVFQLNPSLLSTQPTLMFIPDGVGRVEWIKYFDSNPLDSPAIDNDSHDTNVNIPSAPLTFTSTTSNLIGLGNKSFTVPAGLPISINSVLTAVSGVNSMTGTVLSYQGAILILNVTSTIGSGTFASWSFTFSVVPTPPGYRYVTMLPIRQFLDTINNFNPSDTNVQSFIFSDTSNNFPGNFTFYYKTDRQPCYCCILSNYYVIFDSYDNTQDTTLQASKTMCFGQVVPTFKLQDTFIPDLDSQQFPLLVNEAKSLAFFELKQQPHMLADREVKRQWSTVQKNKSINNRPTYFDELANFGRRSGNYYGTRGFDSKYHSTNGQYV